MPKPQVRIVEDEELLLELFIEVISETGAEVHGVPTADAGLEAFRQTPGIALLLTDVKTPGRLKGWDLAKAAYGPRADTPVIIMSGYSYDPDAQLLPNATFIRKPCSLDMVRRLVKARLGSTSSF